VYAITDIEMRSDRMHSVIQDIAQQGICDIFKTDKR
jgi:hypothetical protein